MASRTTKILAPLGIIALGVIIFILLISSKKPPEKTETKTSAFLVQVEAAQARDLNFVVSSQGTVQPKISTRLSAQVNGRVIWVAPAFIEGGMFEQGDVLIQLEKDDYLTEVKLAEAELARAEAALEEEVARGKVAQQEWRSVKGNVAPELGLRKPQLAKERANVSGAKAQLERAQRNLERTDVKAPFDGMVKSQNVDLGQFVTSGFELGMVYATDIAEVRMPLSDNDLAFLSLKGVDESRPKVTLFANVAGQQTRWEGLLARDEGVVDSQRRVVYAVAEVADPYLRKSDGAGTSLKFGRFVQAQIVGARGENIIVLPRNVLRLDGTIMTVNDKRELKINKVSVQRSDEDFVYINGGIEAGDLVVTSAIPNPYNGMKVRLPGEKGDTSDQDKKSEDNTDIFSSGDA